MLTFEQLAIPESALTSVREALYDPSEPGYFVFPNFLSPNILSDLVDFWTNNDPERSHERHPGKWAVEKGCSNFFSRNEENGNIAFHNFFWNTPTHPMTYAIALQIQLLRNRVEQQNACREIFPITGRSANFRVVRTLNGEMVVPPHRDWTEEGACDPKRIQATLFLSNHGSDYSGKGFILETNQGKKVVVGRDVEVRAGDLILWRYNNEHSVEDVSSEPEDLGFLRMIFPPELIPDKGVRDVESVAERLKRLARKNALLSNLLLPVYRRLKSMPSSLLGNSS
jgi:hypothetical protein